MAKDFEGSNEGTGAIIRTNPSMRRATGECCDAMPSLLKLHLAVRSNPRLWLIRGIQQS